MHTPINGKNRMSDLVKGSKYTAQQRADVAIQYAISGNMKRTAKAAGIPRTTIISWQKQDWWHELIAEIRGEKSDEHRAKYSELVDKAQQIAPEKLPEASAAQAHLIACQATDKIRLFDGMPTEITDKSTDMVALANEFRKLSQQWDEKQANVVKTQDKTEEKDDE